VLSSVLQLVLLASAISIGHFLRRKRVLWIGGAGAALLLGVLVGVLIRLARTAPLVDSWIVFQVCRGLKIHELQHCIVMRASYSTHWLQQMVLKQRAVQDV
jgi:hypothetical protein